MQAMGRGLCVRGGMEMHVSFLGVIHVDAA